MAFIYPSIHCQLHFIFYTLADEQPTWINVVSRMMVVKVASSSQGVTWRYMALNGVTWSSGILLLAVVTKY
jgi:hypothetical protein